MQYNQRYVANYGIYVVAKEYSNQYQTFRWVKTSKAGLTGQFQTPNDKCLEIHRNHNAHNYPLNIMNCDKKKQSQIWKLMKKPVFTPNYPLADNKRFRVVVAGGRFYFERTHAWSGDQFYVQTREDDQFKVEQYWTFDKRTMTIREAARPNFAISLRRGMTFSNYQNDWIVTRPYDGKGQKIRWDKKRQTFRNPAGHCLYDPNRGQSANQHPRWHFCMSKNPAFKLSIEEQQEFKNFFPLTDDVKFQIRTKMSSHRALTVREHIGGYQYILRMKWSNPMDSNQYFSFDKRTHTIRQAGNRNMAIGSRIGYNWNVGAGYHLVVRAYDGRYQQVQWKDGKSSNIRAGSGKCMDVAYNRDTEDNTVCWFQCHSHLNQAWKLVQKGKFEPNFPLRDGVKFNIFTRQNGKRVVEAQQPSGNQIYLRMNHLNPTNQNQKWVFDLRTKSIRMAYRRDWAIGTINGYNDWQFGHHVYLVARQHNGRFQTFKYVDGAKKNLQNPAGQCV